MSDHLTRFTFWTNSIKPINVTDHHTGNFDLSKQIEHR